MKRFKQKFSLDFNKTNLNNLSYDMRHDETILMQAQLRSNVYLALDGGEQQLKAKSTLSNNVLSDFVRTSEGKMNYFP